MTRTSSKRPALEPSPLQDPKKVKLEQKRDTSNENDIKGYYEAITERNRKQSPLLRLPGEIRNRIYEYVFSGNILLPVNTSIWSGPSREFSMATPQHWIELQALTYASRVVNTETKLLAYSYNTLQITEDFGTWCETASEKVMGSIKTISYELIGPLWPSERRFQLLDKIHAKLPGVETAVVIDPYRRIPRWTHLAARTKESLLAHARTKGWEVIRLDLYGPTTTRWYLGIGQEA